MNNYPNSNAHCHHCNKPGPIDSFEFESLKESGTNSIWKCPFCSRMNSTGKDNKPLDN